MSKLIPHEPLIYERVNNTVYARYSNRSDIPRWVIGDNSPPTPADSYTEWKKLVALANDNHTLKKQLDNLLNTYYIINRGKQCHTN